MPYANGRLNVVYPYTVVAAFFFLFFFVNENETETKQNENETETKQKRSINGFFETRFEFFRNVLTFSQWNAKNGFRVSTFFFLKTVFRNVLTFSQWNCKNYFRLNAFFFPKMFVQSASTYRKALSQSASTTENVIDRARNWAKCFRENSKTCLIGWIKSIK